MDTGRRANTGLVEQVTTAGNRKPQSNKQTQFMDHSYLKTTTLPLREGWGTARGCLLHIAQFVESGDNPLCDIVCN